MTAVVVYSILISNQQVILNAPITVKAYPISAKEYVSLLDLLKKEHSTDTVTIINIIPLV